MSAAAAQEAEAPPAARVEVTGSRIPTANLEGPSPITVVTAKDIQAEGARSVESFLNNLPQVFADQGGSISNGATGTATVNLRNFGADRTLVLVNGRRLPAGSPTSTAADLNQIPAPLIKRVEVLTGGASAVYGSDAVAGVVNFIMNDTFSGLQLEVNQSFYNHSQHGGNAAQASADRNFPLPGKIGADGKIKDGALTMGGNFDNGKGNAVVYLGYKKEEPILQAARDFTACSLGGFTTGDKFHCGGSGTSYPGRFFTDNGQKTVADANGGVRPYVAATDQYNFGPLNYFQRPSERYEFSSFAHYDVSDKARFYMEAAFHDDHTVAQIAPSGLFGFDASGANAIHYENPFLSSQWRSALGLAAPGDTADALIYRRNVEGGGRQDDIRNTSYRGVIGIKGEIGKWNYDVFAQMGKVLYAENYFNDFSNVRIGRALDAVTDANGNAVCRSVVNGTDPNCVPYNIWSLGKITPAALKYLQTPGFKRGSTSQSVEGFNLSSDLGDYGLKMPLAKSGVGIAFGFEHRTEKLDLATDVEFDTGDLAGQGGPTHGVGGSFSVKDYYVEARVPLLEKVPFAELLSVNASYRNSDYTTGQKTDSYGVGVEWAPIKEIKLRGSYQRAARAANIVELYTAQGLGLFGMDSDPCAGAKPTASLAQCARTGVTAAQYGNIEDSPAQQYNAVFGGAADLKPEKSDSYTLGLVLTPLRDLSFTIDAFDMKVKGVIDELPPATTLDTCLETGSAASCSLITRDRLGTLWALETARILAFNQNLAVRKTRGIDFGANYRYKMADLGSLDFALNGTFLKEFIQEDFPGNGEYDCAGYHGTTCGTPLPKWRHKARVSWTTPWAANLNLTWRHINAVELETSSTNKHLTAESETADQRYSARDYLDLSASYRVNKIFTFSAGINNLFDRDPPVSGVVAATLGNGNTYPQVYDALGRKVFMNLTAKF
ncbi:TonB-dependent receptor domain-containing protein [Massilia sp. S19_KUP03_FR1]|uniref:TonB-dependent receptor domain-containing protein n=1 Tax=Massilia sp. S19_KUP03_FR1 TaxID=3025503 RepID=UPI002FCDB0F2